MFQKGLSWNIGKQSYFVYYSTISFLWIKVNRVETVDMGRSHWNNGFSRNILL